MLKRIRSDRDPRDTLFSEIRKEFGRYFRYAERTFQRKAEKSPRLFFGLMIGLMFLSMILSFTMFRIREKPGTIPLNRVVTPALDGFNKIMETSGRIRETMACKKLIDSITSKKS
jgi:hypothetical protein